MGKSKKGGVFGYLRGRVGDVSYSILSAKRSKSGKKEQIVRILPDSVENPNSVGQILQRMKVKPAAKFNAALEIILSNAFEGVAYGEASRRYFMKKAMEMVGGPYIPKGVDRFIPAEYLMSEGSLNSFPLLRSQASDRVLHTNIDLVLADLNPQGVANALGVPVNTQISFVIINNENGVFVPHYAGFDERITIADLPEAALVNTGVAPFGSFGIDVANLGIPSLTMDNWVAACVILSIQDASGAWLRSSQNMVLNTTMYNDLYSDSAMNAAIASYRETSANNSIGSPWYLNLGLNQAFNGRITSGSPADVPIDLSSPWHGRVVIGEQTINAIDGGVEYMGIRRSVFATDLTDNGLIVILKNGVATTDPALTVGAYRAAFGADARPILQWYNTYAAQGGYTWQGSSTPTATPVIEVFADEACTNKPVAGQSYTKLYVKTNRSFGFGDSKTWPLMNVSCPSSEYPTDPYAITAFDAFDSADYNEPIGIGVTTVQANSAVEFSNTWVTEFFD